MFMLALAEIVELLLDTIESVVVFGLDISAEPSYQLAVDHRLAARTSRTIINASIHGASPSRCLGVH